MSSFVSGFYRFAVWAMRFAYLNILWVAFTVVGLIAFGFMPATTAMFSVVRKWVMGDSDIPVWKTFWKTYKKDFLISNVLGWALFLVGYLLTIEFQILRTQESSIYFIASYGVIALFILLIILVMYFFPVYVHFNLRPVQYLKWPFIIGIIHPILTIFLAVALGVIYYFTFKTLPALLFFFGGSFTAFLLQWGSAKTFPKFEEKTV
jgi:uncharacterized membrane protein YesL